MNSDKTSDKNSEKKQKQAKTDLLRELESLRSQLANPEASSAKDDDIPLLMDKVDRAASDISDAHDDESDLVAMQMAYDDAAHELEGKKGDRKSPGSLPGQQSLFSSGDSEHKSRSRPTARGENPFLPKHIRDRLDERRQALADDIAQASAFFPVRQDAKQDSKSQAKPRIDQDAHQALVDELVAQYLPRIERELRMRLTMTLRENNSESSDDKNLP